MDKLIDLLAEHWMVFAAVVLITLTIAPVLDKWSYIRMLRESLKANERLLELVEFYRGRVDEQHARILELSEQLREMERKE